MKNELINKDRRDYEDEIDLVDLLRILIKNKVLILFITVTITMISILGAFYIRSNRIVKYQQNFKMRNYADTYYSEKAKLVIKSFNVEEILLGDEFINKFYKDKDFNKYFTEKTKGKGENLEDKRKFLIDSIELKKIMEKRAGKEIFKYYKVKTTIEDEVLSKKIIDLYLLLINEEKVKIFKDAIGKESDLTIERREFYKKRVVENEKKIVELINSQPTSILENQSILSVLATINPVLSQKMENDKKSYEKFDNKAIGIKGLKDDKNLDKQIEKLSSIYQVKEKSKSLMILAIGMILGLFLGIFVAFTKEFITSVKWKEKK